MISKAGGSSFTGRTFAGSVHARYLGGRLVVRDGQLSMGGGVGSSGHLECSGSESFSLWLLDVLREDGVVTAMIRSVHLRRSRLVGQCLE